MRWKVDVKNLCHYLHIIPLLFVSLTLLCLPRCLKEENNQIIFHFSSLHPTSNNLGCLFSVLSVTWSLMVSFFLFFSLRSGRLPLLLIIGVCV